MSGGVENGNNFEKIDNERINKGLDNIEKIIKDRLEAKEVLKILNAMDTKDPKDIDMTYDKVHEKYYIIVDGVRDRKGYNFEELKKLFMGINEPIDNM